MARPIPRKLLIHSVKHKYNGTKDSWGNITYANERDLTRVRIEPTAKRVLSRDNTEIQLTSLMFYDCVNSNPTGINFIIGDAIVLGTINYVVESIEQLYDESKLHHIEVGLV